MRRRAVLVPALVLLIAVRVPASAIPDRARQASRDEGVLLEGFRPAILSLDGVGRYFVMLEAPAVVDQGRLSPAAQRIATGEALRSQAPAIRAVEALGGTVLFRYARLVNAFSATMTARAAMQLAERDDVRLVEPVPIVRRLNETSVPFIGAPEVWSDLGVRGRGITVAVVDTGVDYTHANFGGPGTAAAYAANDPEIIEPGSFPTGKVIGGYDFVGDDYDVIDDDPTNDTPNPDPDPLDDGAVGDHGTHVAGTCCGNGVPGAIGRGVAPKAEILAVKVWDTGSSTADVLVAGYEFAVDPDGDGELSDAADVLSFSGGVDHGPPSSTEAKAANGVVKAGTIFVASAGNSGNQPAGFSAYILGTPASASRVIGVAASIDEFVAQTLSVVDPTGVVLPDGGPIVHQEWSPGFTADITAQIVDARQFDPPASPSGDPAPSDRILCDGVPSGSPFAGKLALIYKGPFGAGDCFVEDKVINAQAAGAIGVVIWDGFGGLPGQIGTGGNEGQVTIPAVDLGGNDAAALAAVISPNAPSSYNQTAVTVTIGATGAVIPGYGDRMVDFTSEGPARITSALKPDISAPGADIRSADAGSGDGAVVFSGTSMAAPHVSGVMALLRQIHPTWSPARLKALVMNQATQRLSNLDGSSPVPATVMGSGRVQADEAAFATSVAYPGSVSFGLVGAHDLTTMTDVVTLWNFDDVAHRYGVSSDVRFNDLPSRAASTRISVDGETPVEGATIRLGPGEKARVILEVTIDPDRVPTWQQEYGWYFYNPNVDGVVSFVQRDGGGRDRFHVPWHVSALATAATDASPRRLDLTGGSAELAFPEAGAGRSSADLYLLGTRDPKGPGTEADIAAVGVRSFTGSTIDGVAEGVPTGTDALAGITWQEFLTFEDVPTEPIEFGVVTHGVRNTTETQEIDVVIDVGADGVLADPLIGGDALLVKLPGGNFGAVCLFLLPSSFESCDALHFPDYSNYNSTVTGLPVDAQALGLSDANPMVAYQVIAATGVFAGDVPEFTFDVAGAFDPATGTYDLVLDATDPALTFSSQVVHGFFGGPAGPIDVAVGSAVPGEDLGILVLFPNNPPGDQWRVVRTTT